MANTAVETGTYVGACKACGTRYFAATEAARGYCGCRAEQGHPVTFVKWTAVKGKTSTRECGNDCTHAKSMICSCVCGGDNHGSDLAPMG